jgi:hypothetical protein
LNHSRDRNSVRHDDSPHHKRQVQLHRLTQPLRPLPSEANLTR